MLFITSRREETYVTRYFITPPIEKGFGGKASASPDEDFLEGFSN
jgi:hypothetical protein